jgi:hypothetical protein
MRGGGVDVFKDLHNFFNSRIMDGINWPFGKANTVTLAPAGTGAAAATITDNFTYINLGTFSANTTLTITASAEMRIGARVLVQGLVDGTNRTLTYAGDALGVAQTFTASKTRAVEMIWNGTKFVVISSLQLD